PVVSRAERVKAGKRAPSPWRCRDKRFALGEPGAGGRHVAETEIAGDQEIILPDEGSLDSGNALGELDEFLVQPDLLPQVPRAAFRQRETIGELDVVVGLAALERLDQLDRLAVIGELLGGAAQLSRGRAAVEIE